MATLGTGVSVWDTLKKTYPNLTLVVAVQYATQAGQLVQLIVDEVEGQRTADTAKVLGDLAYWKGLEARGVKYRFYDKDSPEAKQNKYVEFQAEAGGLPFVLLLDSTGKKLDVFKLPVTTAELDAKIGGGK